MCFTKLFYYWCQVFQKTLANYHIIISSLLANVSVFKLSFSWRRWWLGWHHIMTERRERLTDTDTSGLIMLSPRISADWVLQSYTLAVYRVLYSQCTVRCTVHTSEHNNPLHFLLSCQHIIHRPEQIHAMYQFDPSPIVCQSFPVQFGMWNSFQVNLLFSDGSYMVFSFLTGIKYQTHFISMMFEN